MSEPLVSVIIPAYNCAGVLSDTIDSVLKQAYGNIEIVVVDDGSTDGTGKIAEGFLESGKVRWYRQENGGPGAARNRGIQEARGEFLAFVDADDFLTDDSIKKRMALLAEVPDLELVYSNYLIRESNGAATSRFDETYPEKYGALRRGYAHGVVFEGSPSERFGIPFDFWTGALLVGRNLMKRVGKALGFDRDFCETAIAEILDNAYIVDEPPCFVSKEIAKKFVKDGLALAFADGEFHPHEEHWLRSTAEKNGIDVTAFSQELEDVRNRGGRHVKLEVDDFTVKHS